MDWLLIATVFVLGNVLLLVVYLYGLQLNTRAKLIEQGISCVPFTLLGVAATFPAHTHLDTEKFVSASSTYGQS